MAGSRNDRPDGRENNGQKRDDSSRKKAGVWKLAAVLFFVGAAVCLIVLAVNASRRREAEKEFERLADNTNNTSRTEEPEDSSEPGGEENSSAADSTPEPEDPYQELRDLGIPIPDKTVDFADLQENVNEDIYAWLYIEDSTIDFPVLQHPTDNSHYLNYNLDGSKGYPGCIYSENYNQKDFEDPLTVLYGHVMDTTGSMFAGLHKFRDSEYLEEHPYIYIYLPDDKLYVYEIFAAYEYKDSHLLYNHDYTDAEEFGAYLEEIQGIRDMNCVRKEGVELSVDDRILTLSTCITEKPSKRYLVQGVLVNGE